MAQQKRRVLVVDDDPELQELIRMLLARINLEPTSVYSAMEAAESLRTPPLPDLLILDLMMPDVSGIEFLRQMRSKEVFNNVPVLVLSALIDPEQIREALNLGADRYITKPYIASNLTSIAIEMLRTGRRART